MPQNQIYAFVRDSDRQIEARLYQDAGGTYFRGVGKTDAEAIGSLFCHCPETFNAKINILTEEQMNEIQALHEMPDSEIDFSDIPLQNPDDPKWKNARKGT